MKRIILFDGVCHLCNRFVQFVIKRDSKELFYFAPLNSKIGKRLLLKHNVPLDISTIVLIEGNKTYSKSTAMLQILRKLRQPWPLVYSSKIFPSFMRDFFYDVVSKHRYSLFGKMKTCPLPPKEWKGRFLSQSF